MSTSEKVGVGRGAPGWAAAVDRVRWAPGATAAAGSGSRGIRIPVSRGVTTGFSAVPSSSNSQFAVRLGVLKFRGFVLKKPPAQPLTGDDVKPDFEQKGVGMRIGLDIATISALGTVDRIVLITNDTDCVPAMKHAGCRSC